MAADLFIPRDWPAPRTSWASGRDRTLTAIQHYVAHYNSERNHQTIGNRLIDPDERLGREQGNVLRRDRLGGLLRYYYRKSA